MRPLRTSTPQDILKQVSRAVFGERQAVSPWKRLLGKGSGSDRSFLFALERPTSNSVVNDSIDFSGWGSSFVDEPLFAQIVINETFVEEIEFSQFDEDSVHSFELSIPWNDACGENASEAEVVVRVQHAAEEMLFGPIVLLRNDSPLMRHVRGSAVETWGKSLEDSEIGEIGENAASEIADAIANLIEIGTADKVLEIACARGEIGAKLAPRCDSWTGCDFSGSTLSIAIQNLKHLPNIQLEQLAQADLSQWGSGVFNKVYCTSLLMYLDEWDRYRMINEAFRVLAPGGHCYFDSLNLCGELGWEHFETQVGRDSSSREANVMKASTPAELQTYLERAGFERIRVYPGERMLAVTGAKPRS